MFGSFPCFSASAACEVFTGLNSSAGSIVDTCFGDYESKPQSGQRATGVEAVHYPLRIGAPTDI